MSYIQALRQKVGHMPVILTSASGALVNEADEVLLQERADTGDWCFPGGYLEYGESFAACMVREYQEDAGIAIRPVKLLALQDTDEYTYPNGDVLQPINAFYLVEATGAPTTAPKATETVRTKYFSLTGPQPKFFNQQHEKMWAILQAHFTHKA